VTVCRWWRSRRSSAARAPDLRSPVPPRPKARSSRANPTRMASYREAARRPGTRLAEGSVSAGADRRGGGSEIRFPGIDTPLPACECPLLIQEVESIDWVPGVRGRQTNATRDRDGTHQNVTYEFEADDATGHINRLQDALASGFDIEEVPSVGGFHARVTRLTITVSQLEGRLRVTITLMDGATDEEAPEIFERVRQAVGLRGP